MKNVFNTLLLLISCLPMISQAQWQALPTNNFPVCLYQDSNRLYIDGTYFSTDDGLNWNPNGVKGSATAIYKMNGHYVIMGFDTLDQHIFVANHLDSTWTPVYYLQSTGPQASAVYRSFAQIQNALYTFSYNEGVLKSTNYGNTWTQVNTGLPSLHVINMTSYSNYLYVAVEGNGVYKSSNGGANWISVNIGLPPNKPINYLANNGHDVYAATDSSIYISSNGGVTWSLANNAGGFIHNMTCIDKVLFASIIIAPFSNPNFENVYYALNGDTTLHAVSTLPGICGINTASFLKNTNYFFAGGENPTLGCQLFRIPLQQMILGIQTVSNQPAFNLYPNPTTGKLNYESNQRPELIQITGMDGRTYFSEYKTDLTGQIDVSSLYAGIYIISIKKGDDEIHQRFIKLK